MIRVKCEKCNKEIEGYGALVFSPIENIMSNEVLKFHICKHCYSLLCNWMEDEDEG